MSFNRGLDTTNNKANLVYNKVLGYPYTTELLAQEYPASAVSLIPKNVIMAQDISNTPLPVNITANDQINYRYTISSSTQQKIVTKKWNSNTPYIVKYEDLPLIAIPASLGKSYYYRAWDSNRNEYFDTNLLTQAIATNFGDKTSYAITVKAFANNVWNTVAPFNYFFDRDAGVITFFGYKDSNGNEILSETNPPTVTFWRYEGTFGTINQNTDAVFGKNTDGSAYYIGNVAIGKQNVRNGYSLDVSGNINVDGSILQNGVPITGVLDQQYNFNIDANAPRIDNKGDYAVNDGSGNKRDDYSSAIYKIDNWLTTYMLSQPPEIDVTNATGLQIGSELIFIWDHNPQQYQFGFMSRKLPATSLIHAAIDISGTSTITPFSTDIFNDISKNPVAIAVGSDPHRELYVPDVQEITALIISKNQGVSGRYNRNINMLDGSTKNVDAYVYYNATDFSTTMDEILVQVWYSNSSALEHRKMQKFSLGAFLSTSPPSRITTANINNQDNTGAQIAWQEPQYVADNTIPLILGADGAPTYPTTDTYKIEYKASTTHKYIPLGNNITTYDGQPAYPDLIQNTGYTESNLHAGTTYNVIINTKNSSTGYSTFTDPTATLTTTLPPAPQNLSTATNSGANLRFSSYGNTVGTFRSISGLVTNKSFATESIVKAGQTDVPSNTIPDVAVVTTYNIGGIGGTKISDGVSTDSLTGFGSLGYVGDSTNGTILDNATVNIQDVYQDPKLQNLFLKSPIRFKLDVPSGVTSDTITYTQTFVDGSGLPIGDGTNGISKTIYIDESESTVNASITDVTIDSVSTTYTQMCGLNVLVDGTTANIVLKDLLINNIGKQFVNETQICIVDDNDGDLISSTPQTIIFHNQKSATSADSQTSVTDAAGQILVTSLPDNLKVCVDPMVTLPVIPQASKQYADNIPLKLTPYNLKGQGTVYTAKSVPIIIDKSVKTYSTNPEHASEQYPYNVFKASVRKHLISVDNTHYTPSTSLDIGEYFNSEVLTSAEYSTELLYANNAFRYKAGASTYLVNYGSTGQDAKNIYGNSAINYSPIAAESADRYRYAAFKWTLPKQASTSTPMNAMQLQLINLTGAVLAYDGASSNITVNDMSTVSPTGSLNKTDMQIYYRVVDYDVANSPQTPSVNNISTYWINALYGNTRDSARSDSYTSSKNLITAGLTGTGITGTTSPIIDTYITPRNLQTISSKIEIYVLVGIKASSQITFSDVKIRVTPPPTV